MKQGLEWLKGRKRGNPEYGRILGGSRIVPGGITRSRKGETPVKRNTGERWLGRGETDGEGRERG